MKRLLTIVVIFAVLAVCAPSNAYTLVYKLTSTIKTVETHDTNLMMNVKVNGYLALNIDDDTETVGDDDARMVIYGKDSDSNKIYYVEDFVGGANIEWTEEGPYLTLEITVTHSIFDYDLRLIGKIKEKDVGLGSDVNDLRSAPPSLKGSMICTHGSLFDFPESLFGSGTATLTLDIKNTKIANDVTPSTLDDIMTDFVEGDGGLIEKGYQPLILP
jgi:hypothetical protein